MAARTASAERSRRCGRLLAAAVAVFQLAVVLLVPLADATLATRAASVATSHAAHVEASDALHCPGVHSADCAFCRLIATCGLVPTRLAVALVNPRARDTFTIRHGAGGERALATPLPRGPPVA